MAEKLNSLIIRALAMYLFSLLFVVLVIFLPAGSLKFRNGWLFIGVLFTAMIFVLTFLLVKDPELLAKRLRTKEKEKPQKVYLVLSIIVFLFTFIIPWPRLQISLVRCTCPGRHYRHRHNDGRIRDILCSNETEYLCIKSDRDPGGAKAY